MLHVHFKMEAINSILTQTVKTDIKDALYFVPILPESSSFKENFTNSLAYQMEYVLGLANLLSC